MSRDVAVDEEAHFSPSRIKFPCSYGGKILPRPSDGQLKYIGGGTRINSVPRSITFQGYDNVSMEIEEEEIPKETTNNKLNIEYKKKGVLTGFKVASSFDYNIERFRPPIIPPKFESFHKFTSQTVEKFTESPPSEVPPPDDNSLKLLIEGFATLDARCGNIFEDLSKEKNKSNPLFSFLSGGNGYEYYQRKLWEAKQKSSSQKHEDTPSEQKLTAESRGKILGGKPLERSTKDSVRVNKEVILLQSNLTDTFTKPSSANKTCTSAQAENHSIHNHSEEISVKTGIATGNWGCGAFGGDLEIKCIIQWLAASQINSLGEKAGVVLNPGTPLTAGRRLMQTTQMMEILGHHNK